VPVLDTVAPTLRIDDFEGMARVVRVMNRYPNGCKARISTTVVLEGKELMPSGVWQWGNGLSTLFNSKLFADCVIVTADKKEISCHRNILAGKLYCVKILQFVSPTFH